MSYKIGEEVKGTVCGITAFGAFVKLEGGSTGLIHISKLSEKFIKEVGEVLSLGDEVSATVIGVSGGKIALSLVAQKPVAAKQARKPDFESLLSSFRSASDERLSALPKQTRAAKERRRKK